MKRNIGVFDSGIGGLTVLDELKKVLPHENFIYYADRLHHPYGEKSQDELFVITKQIVEYFFKRDCTVIVIACNTATTMCMKLLREAYPELIFVGTVPAIKMTGDRQCKNTLVLATPATIQSERTHELVRDYQNHNQNIWLLPCIGLADAIEAKDDDLINTLLREILIPYLDQNIDSVVLGCTHYPWVKSNILKFLPHVSFYDGANGVAREVKRQLELHGLCSNSLEIGEVTIIDSITII